MEIPIIPFEPISDDVIPKGENWISQIKWDGVRIQLYFDGNEVKLFNRKGNERTKHFPEITNIYTFTNCSSIILDGEVIALDEKGLPSFYSVMKRDSIRRFEKIKNKQEEIPVFYMIFDLLYLNGEWLLTLPLKVRQDILQKSVIPTESIQLVDSDSNGENLFKIVKKHHLEGIVCKDLNSKYVLNGKNKSWKKIKNYRDIIAVVGGITYRGNIVNSLLIGLYNGNSLYYISHVGSGRLSHDEWRDLTKIIDQIKQSSCPFKNPPSIKTKHCWVEPILTVKIQFIEWVDGHSLRQPSILSFMDVNPKECILVEKEV